MSNQLKPKVEPKNLSSSSKNDHVVIWLTREPGCNNELTLFYENGHFKLTKNFFLVWNDYGWDKASNLIFVYQPIIGTRFTYTYNESDIRHDEEGVSSDLYDSLQSLQQDNLFDYGLFLLHSIELFLDEAPFNFNPFKLTKLSNFDDIVLNEELMHIMANPNFQQVAQDEHREIDPSRGLKYYLAKICSLPLNGCSQIPPHNKHYTHCLTSDSQITHPISNLLHLSNFIIIIIVILLHPIRALHKLSCIYNPKVRTWHHDE
ncbi:hypothetical protein JHK87_033975 [Glycine soja]|nr:hypothetical protein JHK87_033975 [Glycine soja]